MGHFVSRPYRSGEGERPDTEKPLPVKDLTSLHSMHGKRPDSEKPSPAPLHNPDEGGSALTARDGAVVFGTAKSQSAVVGGSGTTASSKS